MAKTINKIENEQEQDVELLPQGTPVQDVITLPIDKNKPIDTQWYKKFGGITYPINLQNKFGKTFDDGQLKAIVENGYTTGIVTRSYLYIPHGPIDEVVNEFVDNPANGLRLKETKESQHGRNKYWILIDDKNVFKVKNSFVENDEMNFGAIIRNSVGGRLAFGVDLFSFRSICMNGAIFGFRDFGSFSVRHFGSNFPEMTANLFKGLREQLGAASEMINYYNKFATTKLENNKPLIEKIAEHISLKYFPEDIIVKLPNKTKGQEREFTIKKSLQEKSLWFLFNEFTSKIWSDKHESKLSFDMIRHSTKKLHEILIDEIAPIPKKNIHVPSNRQRLFRG
jgi:hypothetical protein